MFFDVACRLGFSYRTVEVWRGQLQQFILFYGTRHPRDIGKSGCDECGGHGRAATGSGSRFDKTRLQRETTNEKQSFLTEANKGNKRHKYLRFLCYLLFNPEMGLVELVPPITFWHRPSPRFDKTRLRRETTNQKLAF
jgi:hypothetical protein